MEHYLWVEKYRPKTIEQCILPKRLKLFFQEQVNRGELQNMLLLGGPGTGKTTAAKAMCNQMGIDVLFINASEQGGIDTLRTTIRGFASSVSFLADSHRCVILDESDYLNASSTQPALRGMIEEFASNCRFILTANFGNRIIDPIKSRCAVIDFSMKKEEKMECLMALNTRVKDILTTENIKYTQTDIVQIIQQYFPDNRKIINEIQRNSHSGSLVIGQLSAISDDAVKELISYMKSSKFESLKKWIANNVDIDFHVLSKMLFDKLMVMITPNSIPELVLTLAEYDYRKSFVVNGEIHTLAMLLEIMTKIEWK